jgi:hypothetical protein
LHHQTLLQMLQLGQTALQAHVLPLLPPAAISCGGGNCSCSQQTAVSSCCCAGFSMHPQHCCCCSMQSQGKSTKAMCTQTATSNSGWGSRCLVTEAVAMTPLAFCCCYYCCCSMKLQASHNIHL